MLMFYYYTFLVILVSFLILYIFTKNTNKSIILSFLIGLIYFIYLLYKFRNILFKKNKYKKDIILNQILELKKIENINFNLKPGKTYSYKTFRLYYKNHTSNKIPKIIFRMSGFSFENLPKEIKNVLDNCTTINPQYIQIYLDNNDCDLFIEEFYPQYSQSYHSIIPGAFKSDIIRLLLLYKYGGVYSDIGHTFLKPIDIFIDDSYDIVFVKDRDVTNLDNFLTKIINKFSVSTPYAIHNAFILISPNHPLLLYIINYIDNNISQKKYGVNSLDITGPLAVGKAYNIFFERDIETPLVIGTNYLKKYKIKILYLNSNNNNKLRIVDEKNQEFINTKFSGYYNLMYSKNPGYPDLWRLRLVYD